MKKNLIALAVLAASGAAFAQSNVTLYGVADIWFGQTSGTGVETQTVLESGGVSGSRWGVKGSEDLGGGLKANFLLEQGFKIDTGAGAAGQAFSRQSYVGFSGGFGEVKLGKMWTAYDDISGAGNSAFDSALAPSGIWKSTGYNANPANSMYYASPSMSGFSGAISYSLGENKTAATDAGNVTSVHVKYEGGPVYVGLGFQSEKATGNATAVEFTRLNGSYAFGAAKLLAGYGKFANGNAETTEWELGADYSISSTLAISGGIAKSNDNAASGDASRKAIGLAAAYSMSKRTTLYAGYSQLDNDHGANYAIGNLSPAAGDKHEVMMAGMRHRF